MGADFNNTVNSLDLMEVCRFLNPTGREYILFKCIMTNASESIT